MVSRQDTYIRTSDGFSVGVVITVPPFPYSTRYEELGKGMPISFDGEMTGDDRDAIHYGEVTECDGQMVTAGMIGYIAVVTGVGGTIAAARESCYRVARKIVIPNARYRNDIGEKLMREDFDRLKKLGWLAG
jgi:phosphoribosylamine--glycine ligase